MTINSWYKETENHKVIVMTIANLIWKYFRVVVNFFFKKVEINEIKIPIFIQYVHTNSFTDNIQKNILHDKKKLFCHKIQPLHNFKIDNWVHGVYVSFQKGKLYKVLSGLPMNVYAIKSYVPPW